MSRAGALSTAPCEPSRGVPTAVEQALVVACVQSLCGTSTLDVRASDSVDALTSRVEEAEGFPAGVVVLSWAGKVLRCGRALADYGVCDAATVTLLLRVSGGAIDFQNRHGSKPGSGGAASAQQAAIDQRERLRKLALETIDITKDPYFMRNHLGTYECKLCLTLHPNEGNYLAHTQGKRHQENLKRRGAAAAVTLGAVRAVRGADNQRCCCARACVSYSQRSWMPRTHQRCRHRA